VKPIVKFYKQFLQDLGLTIGDDDEVMLVVKGHDPIHIKVNVKRGKVFKQLPLYLPTDRHLNVDNGDKVYFHPAGESCSRGQSEVFNATLKIATERMFAAVTCTVDSLLKLCADREAHSNSNVTVEAVELLRDVGDVSKPTVEQWKSLFKKTTGYTGERPIMSVVVGRNKTIDKVSYSRICGVRLPILDSADMYDIKLTKTAQMAIRKSFDLVLGSEPCVNGSNSPTAPYFMALAKTYHQVMTSVMSVVRIIEPYMHGEVKFDGRWLKSLDKLHDWYRNDFYIQLEGNLGLGKTVEEEDKPASNTQAPQRILTEARQDSSESSVRPVQMPTQQHVEPIQVPVKEPVPDDGIPRFKPPTGATLPPPLPAYQQYGYGQQPQNNDTYFDSRTGTYRPRGSNNVAPNQQPQYQQPQQYPPGYAPPQPQYVPPPTYQQPQQPMGYPPQVQPIAYDQYGRPIYR
jgi:hypothetical protein